MIQTLPTQADDLEEVGQFLHERLGRRFTRQAWVESLRQPWAASSPNHGMHLRLDGKVVGVLCAIYSEQVIDGRTEQVCNPHSWVVDEEHRNHSIGLLLQLLRQRQYHFTMFTPNPKVAQVFKGLRFRVLDNLLLHVPHWPGLLPAAPGSRVESDPSRIAALLSGTALRDFQAHAHLPWLRFVAFGRDGDMCLVVYKLARWKKMPCAAIAHVSDAEAMDRHGQLLRRHLLLKQGIPVSRVEARILKRPPPGSLRSRRGMPKMVLSPSLTDHQVTDLYSELMALDL